MKYLLIVALMFISMPARAQQCLCSQIGSNDTGSIEVRGAGGETFGVWFNDRLAQYTESGMDWSFTTFYGAVRAEYLLTSPAVFAVGPTVDIPEHAATVVVTPAGDTVAVHLPVALYNAGRRITIKVRGIGHVDVQASYSWYLDDIEMIDDGHSLMLSGAPAGPWEFVTLEAWATSWPYYRSGWLVVGG